MVCHPIDWAYCLAQITQKECFCVTQPNERETFCKVADADGFVRGETLDIVLGMFDENELDHLFKEEMDNIKREVIIL